MTFGEKLQALRKARGWSQEELASQIHVSRQALSKWESGGAVPDTENIIALSRLFSVTTDYLLLAEHETSAQAAPAAATPRWRKNWPTKRLVLAVAGIIGLIGVVVLSIWGSVLPDSHEGVTAIGNLNSYYHLTWLTLPLQAMLLFGGVGSIFYDRLRRFWHEDVLNDGKEKRL